ncbi:Putative ribonuclease H protein At1g65750 [Linum perenne]
MAPPAFYLALLPGLCKRRNSLVFRNEVLSVQEVCSQVKFWVHLSSSSWKALQVSREAPGLARQAHLIGWRPAGDGWFTLNSDGSLYSNPNKAASGGLLRDDNCRFVYAFTANLGICSIMRAELKGTIEGMKLAWDKGMRKLRVQSDSKVVVDMISSAAAGYNTHAALLLQFTELCSREWQVSIHHIYREANFAVDYPANLGHSFDLGI